MRPSLAILLGLGATLVASCQAASPPTTPPPATAPAAPSPSSIGLPRCFEVEEVLPFAFLPGNDRILLRAISGVQIVDIATSESVFLSSPQALTTAAVSPEGEILAWALESGVIQLVRVADEKVLASLQGHADPVYDLRFSAAGDRLFSASHDGWVRIWDRQGHPLPSINTGSEVLGIGVSRDGALLATIPSDGPVRLWNLADNSQVAELGGTAGYDTSDATFSPDGRYVAADLATGLFLWSLPDGQLVWDEVRNSMTVAFSPDGRLVAYADIDDGNKIILASPDGAQTVAVLGQLTAPVWELFFSTDGSLLAATDGIDVPIWDVADGTLLSVGKINCG